MLEGVVISKSKFKAFADNSFYVALMAKFVSGTAQNIVQQGENAFYLSHSVFKILLC